jgi:hypothetical protein
LDKWIRIYTESGIPEREGRFHSRYEKNKALAARRKCGAVVTTKQNIMSAKKNWSRNKEIEQNQAFASAKHEREENLDQRIQGIRQK